MAVIDALCRFHLQTPMLGAGPRLRQPAGHGQGNWRAAEAFPLGSPRGTSLRRLYTYPSHVETGICPRASPDDGRTLTGAPGFAEGSKQLLTKQEISAAKQHNAEVLKLARQLLEVIDKKRPGDPTPNPVVEEIVVKARALQLAKQGAAAAAVGMQQARPRRQMIFNMTFDLGAEPGFTHLGRLTSTSSQSEGSLEFVVNSYLGQGATGKVYDTTYQGIPAVLKVACDCDSAQDQVAFFSTEVKAYHKLKRVQGKGVPQVLGVGMVKVQGQNYNTYPALAMTKVGDGASLQDIAPQLTPGDLPHIAKAAMSSLQLVHSCKVAHCDLCMPGNVLLDKGGQVKLVDFSHASVKPTSNDYEQDIEDLVYVLAEMAAGCLDISESEARQAVEGWI